MEIHNAKLPLRKLPGYLLNDEILQAKTINNWSCTNHDMMHKKLSIINYLIHCSVEFNCYTTSKINYYHIPKQNKTSYTYSWVCMCALILFWLFVVGNGHINVSSATIYIFFSENTKFHPHIRGTIPLMHFLKYHSIPRHEGGAFSSYISNADLHNLVVKK